MAPAVRAEAGALTARGERTRSRLVAAGEEVFGLRGYHDASIAEITQTAHVAQGTFYLYFDGKRELMRAVVEERGHELRETLARATRAGRRPRSPRSRPASPRSSPGWRATAGSTCIVRQAEYVDGLVYRGWYRQLADGYAQCAARGHRRRRDRACRRRRDARVRADGHRRFRRPALAGHREAQGGATARARHHRPAGPARADRRHRGRAARVAPSRSGART